MIYCIGEDRNIHRCEVHKDTAKCGVKVWKKKLKNFDYTIHDSCYECTY